MQKAQEAVESKGEADPLRNPGGAASGSGQQKGQQKRGPPDKTNDEQKGPPVKRAKLVARIAGAATGCPKAKFS